ncbi:MAG: type IV secretion system DNA-binding domain-containing protein [Sulfuricella sp.]
MNINIVHEILWEDRKVRFFLTEPLLAGLIWTAPIWKVLNGPAAVFLVVWYTYLSGWGMKVCWWGLKGWLGMGSKPPGERIRGAHLVDSKQLTRLVQKKVGKETFFKIGDVPVPIAVENRGFLFSGAPGTGKSQAFNSLLYQARQRGDRAVVFDMSGQFLERFWREGDVILNPLDSRSVDWSPWAEIHDIRIDADKFSKLLIPDGTGSGAEWNFFAQTAVAAILKSLAAQGKTTNFDLANAINNTTLEELNLMVAGTAAARVLNPAAKAMAASVLGILGAYTSPLQVLDSGDRNSFSLKNWMKEGKGWIFITARDDQIPALEKLISCWIDILISALLSLSPDQNRRVVFALNEFATLPRINSILDLLMKGRKYGAVPILGLQSISQARSKYGREDSQTILSCLGNWFCLRSPDAETAEYMAKFLGDMQVKRITQSKNQSGGADNWSEQITSDKIVMPAEIQNLPDLTGYLNLAGDFPIAKIKTEYQEFRIINSAFE